MSAQNTNPSPSTNSQSGVPPEAVHQADRFSLALDARCQIAMARVLTDIDEATAFEHEMAAWSVAYRLGYHALAWQDLPAMFADSRTLGFAFAKGQQDRPQAC